MRTLIAALTIGFATLAHADGIYKWIDEDGQIHYGSQPPKHQQVEVVKAPSSARYRQWQQEQIALLAKNKTAAADAETAAEPSSNASESAQPREQADTTDAVNAARALRCRNAQARLQELERHARIREVDANGNYRVLQEEERQERIRQTRDTLQNDC